MQDLHARLLSSGSTTAFSTRAVHMPTAHTGAPITAGLEQPTREAWMTELPPEKQRDLMGELMNQVRPY